MERDITLPNFETESETGKFLQTAEKILQTHGKWTGGYSRTTTLVKLDIDGKEKGYRLIGNLYGINSSSPLKRAVISEDGWVSDSEENVEVPYLEVLRNECCFGGCPGIGLGEKSNAFEILEKIGAELGASEKSIQRV